MVSSKKSQAGKSSVPLHSLGKNCWGETSFPRRGRLGISVIKRGIQSFFTSMKSFSHRLNYFYLTIGQDFFYKMNSVRAGAFNQKTAFFFLTNFHLADWIASSGLFLLNEILGPFQSSFIPGRSSIENLIISQEGPFILLGEKGRNSGWMEAK